MMSAENKRVQAQNLLGPSPRAQFIYNIDSLKKFSKTAQDAQACLESAGEDIDPKIKLRIDSYQEALAHQNMLLRDAMDDAYCYARAMIDASNVLIDAFNQAPGIDAFSIGLQWCDRRAEGCVQATVFNIEIDPLAESLKAPVAREDRIDDLNIALEPLMSKFQPEQTLHLLLEMRKFNPPDNGSRQDNPLWGLHFSRDQLVRATQLAGKGQELVYAFCHEAFAPYWDRTADLTHHIKAQIEVNSGLYARLRERRLADLRHSAQPQKSTGAELDWPEAQAPCRNRLKMV